MESQQQAQIVETNEVIGRQLTISIRFDQFQKLIADQSANGKYQKLNSKALNDYLAKDLGALEHENIKITHKKSTINNLLERSDSKYFSAHGFCSQSTQCDVKYAFKVNKKPTDVEYVQIETVISGKIFIYRKLINFSN